MYIYSMLAVNYLGASSIHVYNSLYSNFPIFSFIAGKHLLFGSLLNTSSLGSVSITYGPLFSAICPSNYNYQGIPVYSEQNIESFIRYFTFECSSSEIAFVRSGRSNACLSFHEGYTSVRTYISYSLSSLFTLTFIQ